MDCKRFGWTGIHVPLIGQGTWRMGDSRGADEAEVAAVSLGIDLGLTHIDTAEMYGDGGAEEVVAAAIRGRQRADLFIVSKVLPQHATYNGTIAAAEQSLRRLHTEYLDLYLLHWAGSHPIAETMGAMEDLVTAGKIRGFGVSNFDVDGLRQAMAVLSRGRVACNASSRSSGTTTWRWRWASRGGEAVIADGEAVFSPAVPVFWLPYYARQAPVRLARGS